MSERCKRALAMINKADGQRKRTIFLTALILRGTIVNLAEMINTGLVSERSYE